jgi:hypothetical protein
VPFPCVETELDEVVCGEVAEEDFVDGELDELACDKDESSEAEERVVEPAAAAAGAADALSDDKACDVGKDG